MNETLYKKIEADAINLIDCMEIHGIVSFEEAVDLRDTLERIDKAISPDIYLTRTFSALQSVQMNNGPLGPLSNVPVIAQPGLAATLSDEIDMVEEGKVDQLSPDRQDLAKAMARLLDNSTSRQSLIEKGETLENSPVSCQPKIANISTFPSASSLGV